jgi:hypothetical protein
VVEAMPIPASTFITDAARNLTQPESSSTTIRQGALAQKLLAMQIEKNKILEDKKIAVLEARYIAELKRAEENAKKKIEQDKRKAEIAEERARGAAARRGKRKYDA